jgi:geranylgeranyl diphosphate synthase type II
LSNHSLTSFSNEHKELLEAQLHQYITQLRAPASLKQSMEYSLKAGGKRIRPLLLFATLHAFGWEPVKGIHPAIAIEMIHTYSLIHDDLPSMDDDDLRRGKPTNHKVFGEALAILAGDALLTYSFEIISGAPEATLDANKKIALINLLAKSSVLKGWLVGKWLTLKERVNN